MPLTPNDDLWQLATVACWFLALSNRPEGEKYYWWPDDFAKVAHHGFLPEEFLAAVENYDCIKSLRNE